MENPQWLVFFQIYVKPASFFCISPICRFQLKSNKYVEGRCCIAVKATSYNIFF
ncbi:hypothetical protein ACE6H2_017080 [Prunus campanulata]